MIKKRASDQCVPTVGTVSRTDTCIVSECVPTSYFLFRAVWVEFFGIWELACGCGYIQLYNNCIYCISTCTHTVFKSCDMTYKLGKSLGVSNFSQILTKTVIMIGKQKIKSLCVNDG